jgi:hypothetical protein
MRSIVGFVFSAKFTDERAQIADGPPRNREPGRGFRVSKVRLQAQKNSMAAGRRRQPELEPIFEIT